MASPGSACSRYLRCWFAMLWRSAAHGSSWHSRLRAVLAPPTVSFKARGRSAWLKPYGRSSPYVGGITPEGLEASGSATFIRLDHQQMMTPCCGDLERALGAFLSIYVPSGVQSTIQCYG